MAGAVVGREQVLAFRAARHGLDERRPPSALLDVAGSSCGIQDTPPGSAAVALAARLDLDAPPVTDELLTVWSVRGAPHLVPPADHALFTLGVLPAEGTREGLWGQPEHALVEVEKAMLAALRKPKAKAEVSAAVTASKPELAPFCRACDVHHPNESVFRAAPLLGRIVLHSTAPVVLARAESRATGDVDSLRTELLLRYLRAYAPTTSGHFAEWAWISKADAKQRWAAVADGLVKVGKGFVLEEDLDALQRPAPVTGVRLLPNKDAFLQARDRDLLFAEPAHRKQVFPMLGGPGVVLQDAVPVGSWRGAAKGKRYAVTVEPFGARLAKATVGAVEQEAQRVAVARGHEEATLAVS